MELSDKQRKIGLVVFIGGSLLISSLATYFYQIFFAKNFLVKKEDAIVFVRRETTFDQLLEQFKEEQVINNVTSFAFVAKIMKYKDNVKGGRYLIKANSSNVDVVRTLRSGQLPVEITFNNIRTKRDLARKISKNVDIDSLKFYSLLNSPTFTKKYGFDTTNIMGMFIPNTYQVYWTVTEEELCDRMYKEYQKFWTKERKDKATKLNLSPQQVTVLASIVEAESKMTKEQPTVAGVYLNRLNVNMPLQADPTVVFAWQDFSIKRILAKHTQIDSPYNTYKYTGLPPAPINLPSITAIDAVLNYEKHKYLFFCAKEDFSGYHNFAETLREHNANADRYHRALDKLNIKQ